MAGDLEDFLRRAAQRRQAKAAQQQPPPPTRAQPHYSDSRTERVVPPIEEAEEILTAEIVEDTNSIAARMHRLEEARRVAAEVEEAAHEKLRSVKHKVQKKKAVAVKGQFTGNPAADLINALRQPGGIQQAILLREILDPPEHRW